MPAVRFDCDGEPTYSVVEMDAIPRIGERVRMGRYMYRVLEVTHDIEDTIPATVEIARIAEAREEGS